MDAFWKNIDNQLDHIERDKPDTAAGVIAILNQYGTPSSGAAFFAGSGGDRSLNSALTVAGWELYWAEANYYWVARHPVTGDLLTYVEGDVYAGDARADMGTDTDEESDEEEEAAPLTVEAMWDRLEVLGVTEQTLQIVTSINGYSTATLEDVLHAHTGYRSFDQIPD